MESDAQALVGIWRFERVIDDRREGRSLHVAGTATFAEIEAGLIEWSEEGVLERGGDSVPIAAHRVLRRDPVGSWAVEFADGRPFHPWRTGVDVVHDCAPDVYCGRVEAAAGDPGVVDVAASSGAWTQTWDVSGPTKRYTMTTTYRR